MKLPGGNMLAKMQEQMKAARDELAEELVSVTSDGGAVTVVISGTQRVQSIHVAPELLHTGNPEALDAVLVATVNKAIEESQLKAAERLGSLTGGIGLPGL